MGDPLDDLKPDISSLGDPTDPEPKRERKQRSDKGKPRGPRGARKPTAKMGDVDLQKGLEQMLAAPALAGLFYPEPEGKAFLMNHFASNAEWGAKQLVEASKLNPALRSLLEKMNEKTAIGILVTFAVVYFGAPVIFIMGMRQMAGVVSSIPEMEKSAAVMMAQYMAESQGQGPQPEQPQQQPGNVFPFPGGGFPGFPPGMMFDATAQDQPESDAPEGEAGSGTQDSSN